MSLNVPVLVEHSISDNFTDDYSCHGYSYIFIVSESKPQRLNAVFLGCTQISARLTVQTFEG